jgi:hypothetical protein
VTSRAYLLANEYEQYEEDLRKEYFAQEEAGYSIGTQETAYGE